MKNDEDAELLRLRFALDERLKLAGAEKLAAEWMRIANDKYIDHRDRDYLAGYDAALKRCAGELRGLIAAAPKLAGEDGRR